MYQKYIVKVYKTTQIRVTVVSIESSNVYDTTHGVKYDVGHDIE